MNIRPTGIDKDLSFFSSSEGRGNKNGTRAPCFQKKKNKKPLHHNLDNSKIFVAVNS